MKKSYLILTDSGGIEEEGSSLGIPILVLKEVTDRMDGIYAGSSSLVGFETEKVYKQLLSLIVNDKAIYDDMKEKRYPFGKGEAAEIILRTFDNFLYNKEQNVPKLNFLYTSDTDEEYLGGEKVDKGSIGVILTVYKRNYNLKILSAIYNQTVKAKEVWIWQNENHVDLKPLTKKYPNLKIIRSTANTKFHGRLLLPLLMRTEYVAIFDDDVIPGNNWFKVCLKCVNKYKALCGANGRVIDPDAKKYGSSQKKYRFVAQDTEVDFCGHIWFFKRKWIRHFWREPVPTFATAEDMSLSASMQIHGGIKSYVPGQGGDKENKGHKKDFGMDEKATFKTEASVAINLRFKMFDYWRERGWSLLNERLGRREDGKFPIRHGMKFEKPKKPEPRDVIDRGETSK